MRAYSPKAFYIIINIKMMEEECRMAQTGAQIA